MPSKDEDKKAAAAKKAAALKKANDSVQASKNASQPNDNIGIDEETAAQYDAAFKDSGITSTPTSTVEPPTPTSSEGTSSLAKFGEKIEGKEYKASNVNNFMQAVDDSIDETNREHEEREQQQQQLSTRQGIASGLEDLSRRGALTGDLLKQARERATTAGVSDEQFNSFMDKNRIRPSNFATAPKSSSPQEAAQNALFEAEHGSALRAMDIRSNDPNYKFGSGSVLNQPARRVGPESGRLRNAARRLRRKGYTAQAGRMAEAAEIMRLGEPNIDTPELRRQRMSQKILAGKEAQRQDKAYASSAGAKLGQSGSGSRGEEVVTSYKPKPSDTDLIEQASIPKRSFEQYMKELKAVAGDNQDMFGTA
jgi:hypothetical protein